MSKWISVKDKLPEDRRAVLVTAYWHETYQVMMGSYYGDGLWWCVQFNNTGKHEQKLKPKAWMELPKAYAESENNFDVEQIFEKAQEVLYEEREWEERRSGMFFNNKEWKWHISEKILDKIESEIYDVKRISRNNVKLFGIPVVVEDEDNCIMLINARRRISRNVYDELNDE